MDDSPRPRSAVRALALAGLDVAIGMLLISLLVVAGAVARVAMDDGTGDVRQHPLAKRTAFELQVKDPGNPELAVALEQLSSAAERQAPSPAYELEDGADGLWLVEVRHPERPAELSVSDALAEGGLWTGRLTTDRQLFTLIAEVLERPSVLIERLNALGLWFLASTGIGLLLSGLFLLRRREHLPIASAQISGRQACLLAIGLGVCGYGAAWLLGQASAALGYPAQEQEWAIQLARGGWRGFGVLLAAGVLLAPLAEEVFFRGHLLRSLAHSMPPWLASVVSAFYFAAIHMNPPSFHIYLFFGFLLNWAYLRWGRLWMTIVAHMVVNGIGIAMLRMGA
jgi:membrane protease YdiL (CAAX protease family)